MFDHEATMLAEAIADSIIMLPSRPRAWMAKHGGITLPYASSTPRGYEHLVHDYRDSLKQAKALTKPHRESKFGDLLSQVSI